MRFKLIHKPHGERVETEEDSSYLPAVGDLYTPADGPQVKITLRAMFPSEPPILHGMKALQEGDNET